MALQNGQKPTPTVSSRTRLKIPVPWIICLVLAIWLGRNLYQRHQWRSGHTKSNHGGCVAQPLRETGYQLINPLLTCDVAGEQAFPETTALKNRINTVIKTETDAKRLTKISLYFRNYTKGQSTIIGEQERFAPGSLLKVPVLIAYLKLADDDPEFLNKKFTVTGEKNYNNGDMHAPPKESVVPGQSYTVEDLLNRMIRYSDNNAAILLMNNLSRSVLIQVYTDLGILPPSSISIEDVDFFGVKEYSYFFRVLYNATYLSREMSEKALRILIGSEFKDGLVAGLPPDIEIAHKFGERTLKDQTPAYQELHDCGLVYLPKRPYLLCVMTQGYDFNALAHTISTISRITYEEMSRNITP